MPKKLKNLKEELLTILLEKTQNTFDYANRLISRWSPKVWELVDKYVPEDTKDSKDEAVDLANFEKALEEKPDKEIEEEEEEVAEASEDDSDRMGPETIKEKLENIPYKTLENSFRRNQILKIIYIIMRSGQKWLSAREVSEFGENFRFKVRPSNIRKGINKKGHSLNLVTTRKRAEAKRNTKEHKVTPKGIEYLIEHLEL
ncbi:MAG: hypothetical protein PF689_14500 [Deltaproteobacteria bacterium]|jgi:hypothetical protein|nr:hypothetical protein [Deltaproteobacteria bacterium]